MMELSELERSLKELSFLKSELERQARRSTTYLRCLAGGCKIQIGAGPCKRAVCPDRGTGPAEGTLIDAVGRAGDGCHSRRALECVRTALDELPGPHHRCFVLRALRLCV